MIASPIAETKTNTGTEAIAEADSVETDSLGDFARAEALLKSLYGFDGFRRGQDAVVRSVLCGRDTLAVMPTGGGKSLCYQIPALLDDGLTVVVTPLVSLMADQLDSLQAVHERRGENAPVAALHSGLKAEEKREIEARLAAGDLRILLAAPERFRSLEFLLRIKRAHPVRLVVDEAHCVSEWGHSFRPEYLNLGRVAKDLGNPPILALTATADERVRDDIAELLGMRDPEILVGGFDRPNLSYKAVQVSDADRFAAVASALAKGPLPAVVYAHTRRQCDELAAYLSKKLSESLSGGAQTDSAADGVSVEALPHAGMSVERRAGTQERFMSGETSVIVATVAFGMGVDKPDIRQVVHAYVPASIPAYAQEAGRAGRDGGPSECLTLYATGEIQGRRRLFERAQENAPNPELAQRLLDGLASRAGSSGRIFVSPNDLRGGLAPMNADSALIDPGIRLRTLCHVVPDRWMIEGVGFVHGLSTRYVRDGLLRATNPDISVDDGYGRLDELAAQCPPGSNGVSYFASNVMNAKSWKHAPPSIVGLSPFSIGETGLGAIFRAVMEEGAYGARGHMEILEEVYGRKVDEITFVGGPSRSAMWSQLLADVLGAKVRVPNVLEATCLGAALCALVGAEEYSYLTEAAGAMVGTVSEYEPNGRNKEAYDELYPRWRALNDHMIEAADKGLAPHMWTGAGAGGEELAETEAESEVPG